MAKRRGNGEGCIYERKKGQWAAVVSDGINPQTGKAKRRFIYGKTRKEVSEKLRTVQNQQATGGIIDAGKLNLTTWLYTWCDAYAKPNIKQSTYESYLHLIKCHIVPELGGILLKKLTTTDIQLFYSKLLNEGNKNKVQDPESGEMVLQGGGLAPATITYIHRVLKAALSQAVAEKKIAVNPAEAAKPPKVEANEMRILTQEQVITLLEKSKDYRYYGAYVLAVTSGMRRGEVLGLPWDNVILSNTPTAVPWKELDKIIPWSSLADIDPWDTSAVADLLIKAKIDISTPTIHISQQLNMVSGHMAITTPKTGRSIRSIDIPPSTACALVYQRYLQRQERRKNGKGYNTDDLVFCTSTGQPVLPRSFTRNFQGAVKHAGLEKIRFHDLRHTVATLLLEEETPLNMVQELLGHYDPTFTAKQYGHVTRRMRSATTDKLGGMVTAAYRSVEHKTEKS